MPVRNPFRLCVQPLKSVPIVVARVLTLLRILRQYFCNYAKFWQEVRPCLTNNAFMRMVSKACGQARAFQSLPEQRKVYRSIVSNIFKCSYYLQIVMCLMFV